MRLPTFPALLLACAVRAEPIVNPVRPGHAPDACVVATSASNAVLCVSSGDLAPVFPLSRSEDGLHWTVFGSVFTNLPAWARGDLREPALFRTPEGWRLVYSARARENVDRRLALASAPTLEGPWRDDGMLDTGTGDATAPSVASHGDQHWLLWRAGAELRVQTLRADGLALAGKPLNVILPKGPGAGALRALHHADHWFLVIAHPDGLAVLRAKSWEGPWTACPGHPALRETERLKNATPAGWSEHTLHYTAQVTRPLAWLGQELGFLPVTWNAEDWPVVGPPGDLPEGSWLEDGAMEDKFSDAKLRPDWSWSAAFPPAFRLEDGRLLLRPGEDGGEARLVRPLPAANGQVLVGVELGSSDELAAAGVGLWASERESVGLQIADGLIGLWRRTDGQFELLTEVDAPGRGLIFLRLTLADNGSIMGETSRNGHEWVAVGEPLTLPAAAWNRPILLGLRALGGEVAFEMIRVKPLGAR
jgi:Glycosyl hydrolases family 43